MNRIHNRTPPPLFTCIMIVRVVARVGSCRADKRLLTYLVTYLLSLAHDSFVFWLLENNSQNQGTPVAFCAKHIIYVVQLCTVLVLRLQ